MKTAVVYHKDFNKYDLGPNHLFGGERYRHIPEVFGNDKVMARQSDIVFLKPKSATEHDIKIVHSKEYLKYIDYIDKKGGMITLDTPVPPGLYEIAKLFAGGNILAGKLIAENILKKVVVLGLGAHHAGYDFGGGFCIINDLAVMIQYLRKNYNIRKIMTIDYDSHCGDGTQDIYACDPDVLCIDFHQDPMTLFPGKGFAYQIGLGKGKGYIVNIPLPQGSSDKDWMDAFNEICLPIATQFQPEIIIANGGLDAHFSDPLSQMHLSIKGYFSLMNAITKLSRELCDDKLILILGGGFNPKVMPLGWLAMVSAVLEIEEIEISEPKDPPEYSKEVRKKVKDMIKEVKSIQKNYWFLGTEE